MDRDKIYENDFLKPIMYWGKRTLLLATIISFAPPLISTLHMGLFQPLAKYLRPLY